MQSIKLLLEQLNLKTKAVENKDTQIVHEQGYALDISRTYLTEEVISLMVQELQNRDFDTYRERLSQGTYQNTSEGRSVFHMGLRNSGHQYSQELEKIHQTIKSLSDAYAQGQLLGTSSKPIKFVVNLGIGGSHLGPLLVKNALRDTVHTAENVFFISNVDAFEIQELLATCPLDQTMFIVASKSFTTSETLLNANYIKQKYTEQGLDCTQHFYAVTSEVERAVEWGVQAENILPFWDWVGGRFSLWGPIGLAASMAIGYEQFKQLLEGAQSVDQHFVSQNIEENIPCLMAMNTIVNHQFLDKKVEVITPYTDRLKDLPEYIQQLQMESNGKNVKRDGSQVETAQTCPAIFGGVGTDMQHAFYQWLHQGNANASVEFIGFVETGAEVQFRHASLSNLLAQSEALTYGAETSEGQENPYKKFEGNTPNTLLIFDKFDAYSLGQLLALYEHKTFVIGVWHRINSFDQWGVELGKVHAKRILNQLEGTEPVLEADAQSYWINYIKNQSVVKNQ